MIRVSALVLDGIECFESVENKFVVVEHVLFRDISVFSKVLSSKEFTNIENIRAQEQFCSLQGLEGDQDLRLNLHSLSVVLLVPNILALVKLIHPFIEVGTWQILGSWLRVVRFLVHGINVEVARVGSFNYRGILLRVYNKAVWDNYGGFLNHGGFLLCVNYGGNHRSFNCSVSLSRSCGDLLQLDLDGRDESDSGDKCGSESHCYDLFVL